MYEEEDSDSSWGQESGDEDEDDDRPAKVFAPARADLDQIMDEFLSRYEVLGGKMRPVLEPTAGEEGGAGKLDRIRRELASLDIGEEEEGEDPEKTARRKEKERILEAVDRQEREATGKKDRIRIDWEKPKERWDCETVLSAFIPASLSLVRPLADRFSRRYLLERLEPSSSPARTRRRTSSRSYPHRRQDGLPHGRRRGGEEEGRRSRSRGRRDGFRRREWGRRCVSVSLSSLEHSLTFLCQSGILSFDRVERRPKSARSVKPASSSSDPLGERSRRAPRRHSGTRPRGRSGLLARPSRVEELPIFVLEMGCGDWRRAGAALDVLYEGARGRGEEMTTRQHGLQRVRY